MIQGKAEARIEEGMTAWIIHILVAMDGFRRLY